MLELRTGRLRLLALTLDHLKLALDGHERLEDALGLAVSRSVTGGPTRRAIEIKVERMGRADEKDHPWYTYWLMVVDRDGVGAGSVGFKGTPDGEGVVEIGYGIDPAYRSQGYTTEAVGALIDWAFREPSCRAIIAPDTLKENVASNRVLEKTGMQVYDETEETLSWRIERGDR